MEFNENLFKANWHWLIPADGEEFHYEIAEFIDFVCSNSLSTKDRLTLAEGSDTSAHLLALLAFDKAHEKQYGDIRLAVARNSSTPQGTLQMLIENTDRESWQGYNDWLDYENDDWSDDVDGEYISDFNNDIRDEITDAVVEAVLKNKNYS